MYLESVYDLVFEPSTFVLREASSSKMFQRNCFKLGRVDLG